MITVMSFQWSGGIKMKVEHYANILHDHGFRELGYFSGLRTFLGCPTSNMYSLSHFSQ